MSPTIAIHLGLAVIPVCTASDGRGIFAATEYTAQKVRKEAGFCPPNAQG